MAERGLHNVSCKVQVYQKAILSNRQVLNIANNFKDVSTSIKDMRKRSIRQCYCETSLKLNFRSHEQSENLSKPDTFNVPFINLNVF